MASGASLGILVKLGGWEACDPKGGQAGNGCPSQADFEAPQGRICGFPWLPGPAAVKRCSEHPSPDFDQNLTGHNKSENDLLWPVDCRATQCFFGYMARVRKAAKCLFPQQREVAGKEVRATNWLNCLKYVNQKSDFSAGFLETIRSEIIIILKQARFYIEFWSIRKPIFFWLNPSRKRFEKYFEERTYELRCNSVSKKNI